MLRPLLSPREQADAAQRVRSAIGEQLQRSYEPPQPLPQRLADLMQRLAEREDRE